MMDWYPASQNGPPQWPRTQEILWERFKTLFVLLWNSIQFYRFMSVLVMLSLSLQSVAAMPLRLLRIVRIDGCDYGRSTSLGHFYGFMGVLAIFSLFMWLIVAMPLRHCSCT